MEEYKKTVIQQGEEIERLTARVSGLEEEVSDSAKNLDDTIKTIGLSNQVFSLKCALNMKDKQINTLMEKHDNLVHKNKENEETIAFLIKDREHCRC